MISGAEADWCVRRFLFHHQATHTVLRSEEPGNAIWLIESADPGFALASSISKKLFSFGSSPVESDHRKIQIANSMSTCFQQLLSPLRSRLASGRSNVILRSP